ncbi:MAG: hypothetical protein R3C42_00300 [Parvularculaceae bacterium]
MAFAFEDFPVDAFSTSLFGPDKGGAYARVRFRTSDSEIRAGDGRILHEARDIEALADWSQTAVDILAQKYLRRAAVGLGGDAARVAEKGVPAFLQRSIPDVAKPPSFPPKKDTALKKRAPGVRPHGRRLGLLGMEVRLFHPMRNRRRSSSRRDDGDAGPPDRGAPILRNGSIPAFTGLMASRAKATAIIMSTPDTEAVVESDNAYERPQPHACFIQSVDDNLVGENGIMDLWSQRGALVHLAPAGHELLQHSRRRRTPFGRRQKFRPFEFPESRRCGGRRDKVRRRHAPRGENGRRRRRSSRH